MADALKAAGNDAVRQGNYSVALDHYKQALAAAAGVAGTDELATLHSNMSFVYLKLGQFQEAVEEADKAVATRSTWSKGYFRRGEASFALREYAKAAKDYAKASELAPEDATIKKKLALAQEASDGFYFRQLLAARDFCLSPTNIVERQIFSSAEQMQNYVYLIGDAKTRECVVVDAAWDVNGIRAIVAADNMKLVGAIVTHYHFDHVGGTPPPPFDALGIKVPGVRELAVDDKMKVYINKNDADTVHAKVGVPTASMVKLESLRSLLPVNMEELDKTIRTAYVSNESFTTGLLLEKDSAVINIGNIKLHFIHTPGHTPGSQCIHIPRADQDILLSGDTLFIGSCGRLDFPDCDPKAMYTSLQKKLASLPENTKVYPGHDYGGPFTTIADEKNKGVLRPVSENQWLKNHHRM